MYLSSSWFHKLLTLQKNSAPPSPLLLQIKNTMITGGAGGGGRGGGGGGGGDKTLLDSSGVDIRRLYRIAKIMLFMAVVVLPGMVLHKSAYSSQFLPALISRSVSNFIIWYISNFYNFKTGTECLLYSYPSLYFYPSKRFLIMLRHFKKKIIKTRNL